MRACFSSPLESRRAPGSTTGSTPRDWCGGDPCLHEASSSTGDLSPVGDGTPPHKAWLCEFATCLFSFSTAWARPTVSALFVPPPDQPRILAACCRRREGGSCPAPVRGLKERRVVPGGTGGGRSRGVAGQASASLCPPISTRHSLASVWLAFPVSCSGLRGVPGLWGLAQVSLVCV